MWHEIALVDAGDIKYLQNNHSRHEVTHAALIRNVCVCFTACLGKEEIYPPVGKNKNNK